MLVYWPCRKVLSKRYDRCSIPNISYHTNKTNQMPYPPRCKSRHNNISLENGVDWLIEYQNHIKYPNSYEASNITTALVHVPTRPFYLNNTPRTICTKEHRGRSSILILIYSSRLTFVEEEGTRGRRDR